MSVVSVCSIKGAPGVTTLTCLLGATWPVRRRVLVAEADESGGDLAARFSLSSRRGWATLSASIRRDGVGSSLEEHLQQLPGGLEVLVAARPHDVPTATSPEGNVVRFAGHGGDDERDVLVDLGRVGSGRPTARAWLEHSDAVVIVARADAATAVQLRERSPALLDASPGPVGLAVVGDAGPRGRELSAFTGMPLFGEVPHDPNGAAVASGTDRRARRLHRSPLPAASSRLAAALLEMVEQTDGDTAGERAGDTDGRSIGTDLQRSSSEQPAR